MKRIKKNKEATAKVAKKPVKKVNDAKAVAKDISARGKKMFLTNRKTVSALKKLTKSLAKLITEANQTGDQKLVGRITKLFGYLGFNTDSDANKVTWCYDAKVKPMKAPKVKADNKKPEKKVRKPRKPRLEKKPADEQSAQPANDGDIPPAGDGAEPTQEELEKLNNEKPPEVPVGDATDLANAEETGSVDENTSGDEDDEEDEDDEDSESDDDSSEDEDEEKEPQSYEDGLVDFRREAWGSGDFERDDI